MIDKGLDTTPELVSDHPSLKNRVADTRKRVVNLPPNASEWRRPPVANAAKFKALQARAAELGKTLPNDQSIANSQQLLQALPRSCVFPYVPEDEVQAREAIVKRAEAAQQQQQQQQQQRPAQRPAGKQSRATTPPQQQVISSPRR